MSNQINKIQLIIIITQDYLIQCKYSPVEKKEILITLDTKINNIIDKEISIECIKDLIINPHEFTTYKLKLFTKEFSVIAEVLLALIIDEYKEQIEKEFIIENTIVNLPISNTFLHSRIITSLEAIGLRNIQLNDEEELEYDYKDQGIVLQQIREMKREYLKRERMIQKVITVKDIQIDSICLLPEEQFQQEIKKLFTLKERSELHLCQLDNYCIFIASRFFDTIDDHINLTKVCKRLKWN